MANESNNSRADVLPRMFTTSRLRRLAFIGALAALGGSFVATAGCMKKRDGAVGDGGMTRAELVAKLERAMLRENPEQPTHEVTLLEGRVKGRIESLNAPTPECKHDEDGDLTCSIISELGKDEDGDDCSIVCLASTFTTSFGPHIEAMVGDGSTEPPIVEAKVVGEGLSSTFEANYIGKTETKIRFGTAKVAVLYAGGYGVTCFDAGPGGRKTFRRVVGSFFESLKFDSDSKYAPVAAVGYRLRTGDTPVGFRYNLIRKRPDGKGYLETNTEFRLKTDGDSWQFFDRRVWVERDASGNVEELKSYHWVDGHGPAMLAAKPGEDKRFRLKYRNGSVSNGLESTPKAPLNTEFWVAPELQRLSAGGLKRYVYAGLSIDDSDPAFFYVALTRSAPGVLMESSSVEFPTKAEEGETQIKNEIHVNEQGLVTKEVTSESVSELLHMWGELPSMNGSKR